MKLMQVELKDSEDLDFMQVDWTVFFMNTVESSSETIDKMTLHFSTVIDLLMQNVDLKTVLQYISTRL